jgi:GNAT superfamily N-acetyltransferase
MNGYRISVRYGFVRSRQLEGTFPGDKETGVWPITSLRVGYGWGYPPEESWLYGRDWPPTEPSGIDLIAKKHRFFWPYRRVRTIAECKEASGNGVMVSLDITDRWANPWRGIIPAPSAKDIRLPTMHHVLVVSFNPSRDEFKFRNSWGPLWGDEGYGYISAERLSATWWEAWQQLPTPLERVPLTGVLPELRTGALKQADGSILHWSELVDEEDERLGWTSAVQTPASFEIEELFVRPNYRGAGHGKRLFQTMETIAKNLGLPTKIWISFADTAPQNLSRINKVVGPSGLSVRASGVRWAPLLAASASDRVAGPLPTFSYPEKPPSVPSEVVQLARDILIGLGTGVASTFIYDAFRSWVDPNKGKRITAKLGDMELSTSEVSVDEFRKLLKALQKVKTEADIRAKILEAGIKITVVEQPKNKLPKDDPS